MRGWRPSEGWAFLPLPLPAVIDRQTRLRFCLPSYSSIFSLPCFPTPISSGGLPSSSRGMNSSVPGKLLFAKTWDGTDVGTIEWVRGGGDLSPDEINPHCSLARGPRPLPRPPLPRRSVACLPSWLPNDVSVACIRRSTDPPPPSIHPPSDPHSNHPHVVPRRKYDQGRTEVGGQHLSY